jgi:3-deoxy-7-phosphoheptulonate synthase
MMIVMTEGAKDELRGPPGSPDRVRDRRIEHVVPLVTPEVMLRERPMEPHQEETVVRGRREIAGILDRDDDRLLVVVGPCSVHDTDAALEYARRLSEQARRLRDDLCVAMRVYFEKPRTTTGWKGLINDPHLDGSGDVNTGLRRARGLLLEVLGLGLPVGCEFLDPITPQYISDTVAWGAIGARTTESQTHRQLASGLSMPVGFKNRTDGDLGVAVDAVHAAAVPHAFAGIDLSGTPAILYTRGNPACHIILRGGRGTPNYDSATVADALSRLRAAGLPERLVIDASHDNSGKNHDRQPEVVADVAAQIAAGDVAIVGTMMESFLVAGRQDLTPGVGLTYGQSITDECMAWDTTVVALDRLAEAIRTRRGAAVRETV